MGEHLRSGWRSANWPLFGGDGQPHANLARAEGRSLFETIEQSGLPDEQTYIVWRGERSFVVLNVFPYTSGHLMVLPKRAVPSLLELDDETHLEVWDTVRVAMRAVKTAFAPHGMNIGINEGMAGGGSVPDHLHVHVVPRWNADTNFMTSVADARVLPETLAATWLKLREAWPGDAQPRS